MKIFPFSLLTLLFSSALCGALVGLIYDFFDRLFFFGRKSETKKYLYVIKKIALDFIFCCFSACIICILLFYYNNGDFRGFACLGFAMGWMSYLFLFRRISQKIFEYFFRCFFMIFAFFLRPFYVFLKFLRKKQNKCYLKVIFLLEKKQKECYNIYGIKYLLEKSHNGFCKK